MPGSAREEHIVVAGFVGSDSREFGRTLAGVLGLGLIDTLDEVTLKALRDGNPELASRSETALLADVLNTQDRPMLTLIRPETFARQRTQRVIEALGASTIFVDTDPAICRERIERSPIYDHRHKVALIVDLANYTNVVGPNCANADLVLPTSPIEKMVDTALSRLRQ